MHEIIRTYGLGFFARQRPAGLEQKSATIAAIRCKDDQLSVATNYLAEQAVSDKVADGLWQSMSSLERSTLSVIIKRLGMRLFDSQQLEAAALRMPAHPSKAALRVGLSRLCERGAVICLVKSWGEMGYCVPDDLFRLFANRLVPLPQKPDWADPDPTEMTITRAAGRGLKHELFRLLVYMARHEVNLTRQGVVAKRHIDKWTSLLQLPKTSFRRWREQCQVAEAIGREGAAMPVGVAVVYEMASRCRLIRRIDNRLVLDERHLAEWLARPADEMDRLLYTVWCRLHMPAHPALQHLIIALARLTPDRWYPQCRLESLLRASDVLPSGMDEDLAEGFGNWLDMMSAFGWMETGRLSGYDNEEGVAVVRLTTDLAPHPERDSISRSLPQDGDRSLLDCWMVQPDFEVIVPPTVSFALRWELEQLADHQSTDRFSLYRLSDRSIARGVGLGMDEDHCVKFLMAHSLYEIPNHVILGIRQWAQRAVASLPPRAATTDIEVDDRSRDSGSSQECLIDVAAEWTYKLSSHWPTIDEIYPDWDAIPVIWLQQLRSYHQTTRKQIVEKAIEWGALIRLRLRGKKIAVCPNRIVCDAYSFQIHARNGEEELVLAQDEWNEIQLLLPGINEE